MRASRRGTGCCRGSGCSPCPAATRWPGKAPEGPRASHPAGPPPAPVIPQAPPPPHQSPRGPCPHHASHPAGPPPAPLIPQAPPPPRQSPLLLFKTTGFCPRSALQVSSHSLMDWGSDRAPRAPRGDEGGPLPRAPGSPRPSFKTSISSSLSFRAWAPLGTAVSRGGTVKPIAPGENSFLPGADPPLAPRPSGSLPVPARRRRLPRRPRPQALRTGSARRGRGGRGGRGGLLCCRDRRARPSSASATHSAAARGAELRSRVSQTRVSPLSAAAALPASPSVCRERRSSAVGRHVPDARPAALGHPVELALRSSPRSGPWS